VHLIDILVVDGHLAIAGGAGDQLVHPVDTAQIGCLPAAGGAHHCNDMIPRDIDIYILNDVIATKRSIEVPALYNCTFHFLVISLVKILSNKNP
jgi:hypothetical protein